VDEGVKSTVTESGRLNLADGPISGEGGSSKTSFVGPFAPTEKAKSEPPSFTNFETLSVMFDPPSDEERDGMTSRAQLGAQGWLISVCWVMLCTV
jgi:hypothetical protein